MGNWRTVNMTGTIDPADIPALRVRLVYDMRSGDWEGFGPLSFDPQTPSLAGLGDWVRPQVFAAGNLAERDYDVADVAELLAELAGLAPSLRLKVHCGGDWESTECVATITVRGGGVAVGPAEVLQVAPVTDEQAHGRLLTHLTRPRLP